MHQTTPVEIPEEEINVKEILWTLTRYRLSIFFFTIIFTIIALIYAYFQPNIYQASATVEIGIENRQGGVGGNNVDIISVATTAGFISPDTEIAILKSRFLVQKALEKVNFTHHYYVTKKMKEFELYNESPFEVKLTKGEGVSFVIERYDKEHYRVLFNGLEHKTGKEWHYNHIATFGQEVSTEQFTFVLKLKEGQKLEDNPYRFKVISMSRAISSVMGQVYAETVGQYSSIIAISYTDNVALRAKDFTNALAEAYINQSVDKKNREASKTLSFVTAQLDKINKNLQNSEVKLENFKKETDTLNLETKVRSVMERLDESESKMSLLKIDIALLKTIYHDIKKGKNLETLSLNGLKTFNATGGSDVLMNLVKRLQESLLKLKMLKREYTEEYPEVISLRSQIEQLKNNLIGMVKKMKENYDEREKLLEKTIEINREILNSMPQNERIFGGLQRKFVINEKIYSYLLEKQASVAISKASTVSNSRILDMALLPRGAISPQRERIVMVGFMLGLIFSIGFALLRAFLDDRIKYAEDITKKTEIPLLGIIPHIDTQEDKMTVMLFPKSIIAEAFRHIRTNLNFMFKGENSHIIAVTSTVGMEGKTTTCINLGGIMSMANKKTIIVSIDMRKPSLHIKCGLSNEKGMSTLLSYRSSLADVIQKTEYKNLDIITAGPIPPNPSELIQGEFMEKILETLRSAYDIIIVDTPPVGLVTDARMLLHLADTTLYVLRAEYSKKTFLKTIEAISKFKEVEGLGIILNDKKEDNHSYGYDYYGEKK